MKRSDVILAIASELVHSDINFVPFNKAQEMAEIILNRIEKEGMLPPPLDIISWDKVHNWEEE